MTPATSLQATHWLESWRKHGVSLQTRIRSMAGRRGLPLRFLLMAAVFGGIALLVFLAVVALILSWSPFWAVLLVPYLAAVAGMVKELRLMRNGPVVEPQKAAPATRPARKTAARKPAAPKPAVQK